MGRFNSKKKIIGLFICILLFFIVNPIKTHAGETVTIVIEGNDDRGAEYITDNSNITIFHKEISGQKFWNAIKMTFLEPTNMTIEYKYRFSANTSRSNFFFRLFHGEDSYFYGRTIWDSGSDADRYFQMHLGPINWSYYHDNPEEVTGGGVDSRWGWKNITGTYYFTYGFHFPECTLAIWINTSKEILVSTTEGTEVFKFTREDFFGNINIGGKRGTIIVNGQKVIHINNSLFAWFRPDVDSVAVELLKYRLPTSEYKKKIQVWNLKGDTKYLQESEDFEKFLWWGPSGKWTFMISMIGFGKMNLYPNIELLGADIQLPG